MQDHVHNCVLRKMSGERKIAAAGEGGAAGGGGGEIKLEDVRLMDEHGEVVLCPFLPDGSTFVLRFKITIDVPPPLLPPPAPKASQEPALPPWYESRAPESPSAEPSLNRRFADRTLPDGTIVPSSSQHGDYNIVQHHGNAPPPPPRQKQQLEVQQMLSAVAALLQQQQQQSGGRGGGGSNELQRRSPHFDSNVQLNGLLPQPFPDVESDAEESASIQDRRHSFAVSRDDEKKEDDENAEDARSTYNKTPISNSPVKISHNFPSTASKTLPSTTTDRLIEEQLSQLNELFLRRRQSSNFIQSNDGDGASGDRVVVAKTKTHPDDQDQANLVRAYRRNEKRQVIFMISNYLLLFLSLIALSAEIQSRLPQWMAWVQQNYDSVQNCATDQGALMECLSNGDFSGLVASFLLWATQSASAKRIFLFGFDTPKKLWTVVYEALVTAVCWGTSYLFIRRGLNPNTRQNFLQLYWKDAVYGSLAGFNAAFMKAVLKNLVPQEVALEALDGRQLRIRHWIHWLMTDE